MQSEAARVYINACNRAHAECAQELVDAFHSSAKIAPLSRRSVPLNDIDVCCIAEAIHVLDENCALRVLNLEENSFGLLGVQALMEAIAANPGRIRELRLGRNNLKDQAAVVIGHTLSQDGCGLKVLDLSENGITKVGVIPIAAALQHPTCDLIELSFHNNRVESDAAVYLADAIRVAPKLKHLHLGYNCLRDSGVTHIARSIPKAVCLSTLDLTANRIGHDGGIEIARAMMAPTCTVQRLNLRHNQLGGESISFFADVIAKNTSLIQLFLGFMNPTPAAATEVLRNLCNNRTLLLLDIYGWKLDPAVTLALIRDIQERNETVAAIVTDACQPIAQEIDEGNLVREDRDLHSVYVGPDDRDAYLATKSLRRFSRAQSRRASRAGSLASSRRPSRSARTGSQVTPSGFSNRDATRTGSRTRSRSSHRERKVEHSAPRAVSIQERAEVIQPAVQENDASTPCNEKRKKKRHSSRNKTHTPRRTSSSHHRRQDTATHSSHPLYTQEPAVHDEKHSVSHEIERLLEELRRTPCHPETAGVLEVIVRTLLAQMTQTHQQYTEDLHVVNTRLDALGGRQNGPETGLTVSNNILYQEPRRQPSLAGSSLPYAQPYRSISRMSERSADRATPMGYPNSSEIRDIPPGVCHPNDESGEQRPEEIGLQRSASVQNFPPLIEPSPAQDHNPPRRKSVSSYAGS